jgi:hypothetical protein
MLMLARLIPLIAVVVAAAADSPSLSGAPPGNAATVPVSEEEIRTAFVGKAACPPEPSAVNVGPWEFHSDGGYVRRQDVASAFGHYAISDGKICVTLAGSDKVDFCLAVLKKGDAYLFRLDQSPADRSRHDPVPVTPCTLPQSPSR